MLGAYRHLFTTVGKNVARVYQKHPHWKLSKILPTEGLTLYIRNNAYTTVEPPMGETLWNEPHNVPLADNEVFPNAMEHNMFQIDQISGAKR